MTGMRYLELLPFVCTYLRFCYMFGGIDVTRNDGLGPAQGYSGLILWLGSIKAMIIGVAVGVCAHFVTRMVRGLAFR